MLIDQSECSILTAVSNAAWPIRMHGDILAFFLRSSISHRISYIYLLRGTKFSQSTQLENPLFILRH